MMIELPIHIIHYQSIIKIIICIIPQFILYMAFVYRSQRRNPFDIISNNQPPNQDENYEVDSGDKEMPKTYLKSPMKGRSHLEDESSIKKSELSFMIDAQNTNFQKIHDIKFRQQKIKKSVNMSQLKMEVSEKDETMDEILDIKVKQITNNDNNMFVTAMNNQIKNYDRSKSSSSQKNKIPMRQKINKNLLQAINQLNGKKIKKKNTIARYFFQDSENDVQKQKKKTQIKKKKMNLEDQKERKKFFFDQTQQVKEGSMTIQINNQKIQKVQKKQKKPMFKKVQKVNECQSGSEYQSELESPGPGSYDYNIPKKKQFRSQISKEIFNNPQPRFNQNLLKFQEVTQVNDTIEKPQRKNQQFLSKSPKKFYVQIKEQGPSPCNYDTRQTMQHDLVRKILKSSNTDIFISKIPRSDQKTRDFMPGVGYYEVNQSQLKHQQQENTFTSSFKSSYKRSQSPPAPQVKVTEEINLLQKKSSSGHNPIHQKKDSVKEQYYYIQSPPFLSSATRFPQIKLNYKTHLHRQIHELKQTPKKNSEGFNSSEKRKLDKVVGEGVGVGLYKVSKDGWNTKSYNKLFR